MKLTNFFLKACLILVTLNAAAAKGRRHRRRMSILADHDDSRELAIYPKHVPQIDFHGTLRKGFAVRLALLDPNKNVVCSPVSALLPLAKLVLGAKGKTRKELLESLGYTAEQFKPGIKQLINSMRHIEGVTLDVVSKIYVAKSARLNPHFEEQSRNIFDSSIERVDFSDRQTVVDTINDFISRETRNMIPNLLSPTDISPSSSLILINAIYFQGNWRKRFDKAVPSTFYAPNGPQTVPMMEVIDRMRYVKSDSLSAEIVELPYKNSNASFIVVLPLEKNGLPMLLTALKLAPAILNDAMKDMKLMTVKVHLPKFKSESKIDLKYRYTRVGVTRIFHDNHDELDGIIMNSPVSVSAAIQKAVIEISEVGTEGAAASGLDIVPVSLIIADVKFVANHPFLYFVVTNSGQQLFSGVFASPI